VINDKSQGSYAFKVWMEVIANLLMNQPVKEF